MPRACRAGTRPVAARTGGARTVGARPSRHAKAASAPRRPARLGGQHAGAASSRVQRRQRRCEPTSQESRLGASGLQTGEQGKCHRVRARRADACQMPHGAS